ncbi:hypothetical protein [Rhizobium lentis]|uniref:Uncharacterized protein n=1 Tax=Rhizobium lentis TaxID=1138194 RepID=A0A9Q3M4L1_9HYPH|nr:hypothetical protein [Rhizobium lentis]MBX4957280.1 hypothetical protein [Rhizobium lentis]MBX4975144.1 hypothetical protein [Rhizobium lentis]MBX4987270.1 hypothetical protein [Rhizobium lentis]MBX4997241.1 hypothetical protein [Rhizobium lentis]MBX5005714.1 hypothetical protein [Rhizobium lentis]
MLEYDPHYPTILPPGIALALVFVLNILAPLLAIFVARRMKRRRWMSHAVAFLWVLLSTFVLGELALPTTAPDEASGPGDGFLLLPIVAETPIVLLVYVLVLLFLRFGGSAAGQDRTELFR